MRKAIYGTILSIITAIALALSVASPAVASDWGGYAFPNKCGNNRVIAKTTVSANGGSAWYRVGTLEIKWSDGCPGNYARFEATPGYMPRKVSISIHSQVAPFNKAGADEEYTAIAYTKVIRLAHYSDRVCAYLDVWVARPNSLPQSVPVTLKASEVLCAE